MSKLSFWSTRRSFLKIALASGATSALGAGWLLKENKLGAFPEASAQDMSDSPISILPDSALNFDTQTYTGDNPAKTHAALWNIQTVLQTLGGLPEPTEKADVVIVGGGIAGLTSAYFLKDLKPIVLDQGPQFGGNSRGEQIKDLRYSIGAAYLTKPDPESQTHRLLKELSLLDKFREETGDDGVYVHPDKQIKEMFWEGGTDPDRKAEFVAFNDYIVKMLEKKYPEIPHTETSTVSEEELLALDNMSFKEWTAKNFPNLHPHIAEFLDEYCWSSFAGDASELSAAQVLNFLCADMGGIIVLPGGNASIAEALYLKLQKTLPIGNLKSQTIVMDVKYKADGVHVCYMGPDKKLKTILAKACIWAAPKFVAKHVVQDLPVEQKKAMGQIKYRAYTVCNVLLKRKVPSQGYALFRLDKKPITNTIADSHARAFSDVAFGSWASNDSATHSVLSLYKALPYDDGRDEIYPDASHGVMKKQFEQSLPDLLTALNIPADNVMGVRVTRFGHALPLAAVGLLSRKVTETASRPVAGHIFFANQDNWVNPSFETSVSCAQEACDAVRKLIS